MKYLREEKRKLKLPLIIGILVVCLAIVVAAALCFFAPEKENSRMAGKKVETVEIQTPYGTLLLEADWVSDLRYNVIQGDVTELTFAAEIAESNVKLFDLHLGSVENPAGYFTTDSGEEVSVGIVVHDIVPGEGWTQAEEELAFTMQEALNEILAQLGMESVYQNLEESEEVGTQASVETSFGVFTYMDDWGGGLRIVDENGCISGFGAVSGKPEQMLFEISFGGEGEIPVGMYTNKNGQENPVFLTVPDLVFDAEWTEQEQSDIYGMQNVLNDILQQLDLEAMEQPVETEPVLEDVSVTTTYGTIAYPGEYNGKLRIAQDYNNGFCIRAFATMPGKTEIHLFDILIGGSGEVFAGTLTDSSGNKKEVYLNVPNLNLDDIWSEEERDGIYIMQTLLNDFCEQLGVAMGTEEQTDDVVVGGDTVIQVPNGTLRYPGEYSQGLATEVTQDNGYTVIFYAKRSSGEKIRLFDVIMGGSGDTYVGQMTAGDGTVLDVYVTLYELSLDDSWSDEEAQTVYEMQEAVNYVLEKLTESGSLVY